MMQGWARRETRRAIHFRRRTTVSTTLEEHYLRDDISCGAAACPTCPRTSPCLAPTVSHYVIPDAAALRECLDIFELPDLADNVILLSSVLRKLADANIRRSARLRALYHDRRRSCVLFDNLHNAQTAPAAGAGGMQSGSDLLAAADWYYEHLRRTPMVLVVSDALAEQLGAAGSGDGGDWQRLQPGVHVLTRKQYFAGRWVAVPAITDVFESMEASAREPAHVQPNAEAHLSNEAVAAGLADGSLLKCVLSVSARDPRTAAAMPVGGGAPVLLQGRASMNRAMHGDVVAVKLLSSLSEATKGEEGDADEGGPVEAVAEELGTEAEAATDLDAAFLSGSADDAAEAAATGEGGQYAGGGQRREGMTAGRPGEVVAMLQRSSAEVVACISDDDEAALRNLAGRDAGGRGVLSVLCVPFDRRLPRCRLRSRNLAHALGQRLVLRIDGWERGSNFPHAHVLRVLGPVNDLRTETDAILAASGVRWQPFGAPALRELPLQDGPGGGWWLDEQQAAAELAAGRRDLRGDEYFVVSIDPPGCTDVDDAMHARVLQNGSIEVGVHIADVSHFVRDGSALDAEAAARCTTVYLVDRRLDMLPHAISEDAASLRAGRDRLAVSVIWTLCPEPPFAVQDVWFGRSLIRSRHQLEYAQVQDLLDGKPAAPGHALPAVDVARLLPELRMLSALGDALRERRVAAGAMELESAELRFQTGGDGRPSGVTVKSELPVMRTVAEMMIFANSAVAKRVWQSDRRGALLRHHAPPRREGLLEVAELCAEIGAPLDLSPEGLGPSLRIACNAAPPALSTLIRASTTRGMSEAQYCAAAEAGGVTGHYGLALPFYTHFTSPIRRYADVVVHRQLLAALNRAEPEGGSEFVVADVSERAAVMNERHRAAKRAQKNCADLFLLLLLATRPQVEPAMVVGLGAEGMALRVFIPRYHTKATIHLTTKDGAVCPPLRRPEDASIEPSPSTPTSTLTLSHDPADPAAGVAIVDALTGDTVVQYTPMQETWVEMGADVSRAHGPRLRLRLLAEDHPEVRQQRAAAVGRKLRPYRPPGIDFSAPKRSVVAPPHGFGPAAVKGGSRALPAPGGFDSAAKLYGQNAPGGLPADVAELGERLAGVSFLGSENFENESGRDGSGIKDRSGAGIEVVTPDRLHEGSAIGPGDRMVRSAATLLLAKAARYALKAAACSDPRSFKAAERAGKAAACRAEAHMLLQHLARTTIK